MNFLRQIVAVLALAVASSGSLPLVVHHLHCHHTDVGHGHSPGEQDSQSDSSPVQGSAIQGETASKSVPQHATCSCAHGCVPVGISLSDGELSDGELGDGELGDRETVVSATLSDTHEDCSVCFQLSQVTSIAEHVATVTSAQLAEIVVLHTIDFDLATVDCNYPPRGPPAV